MQGCLIDANVWIAVSFEQHDHHALANRFNSEIDIILIDNLLRLCGKGDNSPAIHSI